MTTRRRITLLAATLAIIGATSARAETAPAAASAKKEFATVLTAVRPASKKINALASARGSLKAFARGTTVVRP